MSSNVETLSVYARRAARRELRLLLEVELLAKLTLGLALATVALLGALAARLPDEDRIAALAFAAGAVLAASALALARAFAQRPTPLVALLRVDPSGELAAAFELGGQGPLAELAARAALENLPGRRTSPGGDHTSFFILLVAATALAAVTATRIDPPPPSDLGPAAHEATHRAEETRAVREAARQLAARAVELAATAAGREAALELAQAARELDAGSTPLAAIARIARARGKLEATRTAGLGDALDRAAGALADSPALRDLAKAVEQASPKAIEEQGAQLAQKLKGGGLDEEGRQRAQSAAARAAEALSGTPGGSDAKQKLDGLSKDLAPEAAEKAADALAKASEQAKKDAATEQANRALDGARSSLAGGQQQKPRPGGGDARNGEKRSQPNKEAGGDGPRVAGKGGKDERQAPTAAAEVPEPGTATALKGLVGERGASAVMAAEGYARGVAAQSSPVIREFRRSEEEALDKEPLPLDRRRLVKRYFEALQERQ